MSNQEREIALELAVQHHGMANHAEGSVPTGADKVIQTAEKFEEYLIGKSHANKPY